MDNVMTMNDLCEMLDNELKVVYDKWSDYEDREEAALAIGDHGTAAMCRKHIKRLEKDRTKYMTILNEICRMESKWLKEQDPV